MKKILFIMLAVVTLQGFAGPALATRTLGVEGSTTNPLNVQFEDTINNTTSVLATETDFRIRAAILIRRALSLLGVAFIGLLVYGGYLYMTDRGSGDGIDKARKTISAAVVGLVIIGVSYSATIFVIRNLQRTTGSIGDAPGFQFGVSDLL